MHSSVNFLDAIRARHNLPSDYAAAKLIGLTRANISEIRNNRRGFGHESSLKVAALLNLDSGYVLACTEAERAKAESVRGAWARVAAKIGAGIVTSLLLVGLHLPSAVEGSLYYVKLKRRRITPLYT